MDVKLRAKQTIEKILYITIASSNKKGVPWNTPVYSVFDKNYVFYWLSSPKSIHSRNIKENKNVALVIYDSTVPASTGFGVYLKAQASIVNNKSEIEKVCKLFRSRTSKYSFSVEEFVGGSPWRLYKAVPKKIYVNSMIKFKGKSIDIRKEIKLVL